MPEAPKNTEEFSSLLEVIKALRGPEGCPWDKQQTHETLTQYAIEEAHELAEAIDKGDHEEIIEELGDLLLQVVLHAEIARQENRFTISDIIQTLNEKMIRRHPHVFEDLKVKDADEVLSRWADIKAKEKPNKKYFDMPKSLPALIYSQKVGSKTKKYGFDWDSPQEVFTKVLEEVNEVKEAMQSGNTQEVTHEIGDLLFSVVQLARHFDIDAEQSLRLTNQRFEGRFELMQTLVKDSSLRWNELSTEQKEEFWQSAKRYQKTL